VGWSIDGRSREGRFLRAYERMLAEHVGGKPSHVQRELIRRCAGLALHLELQDERSMLAGEMGDGMSRRYLAWSNTLSRTLRLLGLEGTKQATQPTIREVLASRAAAR
jgi:hypothetical protein